MILLLWACSFISQASTSIGAASITGDYSLEKRILNSSQSDALVPSPRRLASTWVDANQNLWLIGGTDTDSNSTLHDVWMFDRALERWLPTFPNEAAINHGQTSAGLFSHRGLLCGSRNRSLGIYGRNNVHGASEPLSVISSASTETHVWVLDLQDATWTKYLCFAPENSTSADHSCPESDQLWVFCDTATESLLFIPEEAGALAWIFDLHDSQWRFINTSVTTPPASSSVGLPNCTRLAESNDDAILLCAHASDPSLKSVYFFDVPQLTWIFLGHVPRSLMALNRLGDYIFVRLNDSINIYALRPAWALVNVTVPLETAPFIVQVHDHSLYYPYQGSYNFSIVYRVLTPYPSQPTTADAPLLPPHQRASTPTPTRGAEKSTPASHLIIDSLDDIRPIASDDSDAHSAIMFFSASLSMFALGALVLFCRKCVKCPPLPLARRQPHRSHVNNKEHSPVRYSVIPDEINPTPAL